MVKFKLIVVLIFGMIITTQAQTNKKVSKDFSTEIAAGYEIGTGDYEADRFTGSIYLMANVSKVSSIGAGIGVNYYDDSETTLIPLTVKFYSRFIDTKVAPFASLEGGYAWDVDNFTDGLGFLYHAKAGISIKIDKNFLNLGVGYEGQRFKLPSFPTGHSIETMGAISFYVSIIL